jgi:hypothetical protein
MGKISSSYSLQTTNTKSHIFIFKMLQNPLVKSALFMTAAFSITPEILRIKAANASIPYEEAAQKCDLSTQFAAKRPGSEMKCGKKKVGVNNIKTSAKNIVITFNQSEYCALFKTSPDIFVEIAAYRTEAHQTTRIINGIKLTNICTGKLSTLIVELRSKSSIKSFAFKEYIDD